MARKVVLSQKNGRLIGGNIALSLLACLPQSAELHVYKTKTVAMLGAIRASSASDLRWRCCEGPARSQNHRSIGPG
ncbi:hypothetical protein ASPSYDRAFT_973826 [Aspergillus sydowii CBS 593.65]|uniref:Uncharacterized protein n=1 Tax=Aspergillus sydowii CBS 593.65 TaxID=1036612 RepID=A0A1L9TH71_9EURO|nr:uncharacterized protein ASPSYDRAFT_973826 [Aspergillus sydowii CBS 593.65]OJJ58790.1 hypothetical protein ASPSYDRAFT_973826 [Aspergillus sydowii CBS 593.65]